jgi:hypothetical protein
MSYDPRTETGIPTEPVGSLPRPAKLQAAYADYDAGKIDHEALEAEQDEAVKDSIARGEATGAPIVSDGEQRWSSLRPTRSPTPSPAPAWRPTSRRPAGSTSRSSPTGTIASSRASPAAPSATRPTPRTRCRSRSAMPPSR